MTHPICLYPKVAQYKGTGDMYDASNYACVAPFGRRQVLGKCRRLIDEGRFNVEV